VEAASEAGEPEAAEPARPFFLPAGSLIERLYRMAGSIWEGRYMQYSEGRMGRIFVLRIDHGEDLIVELRQFITEKQISHALVHFLGALSQGKIVTGPELAVLPPVPHFEHFQGGWEVFGIATVYPGEAGPQLHLHGSVGRGKEVLTGCLRDKADVYIVVEVVITEITGLQARKQHDSRTGLSLPCLGQE